MRRWWPTPPGGALGQREAPHPDPMAQVGHRTHREEVGRLQAPSPPGGDGGASKQLSEAPMEKLVVECDDPLHLLSLYALEVRGGPAIS